MKFLNHAGFHAPRVRSRSRRKFMRRMKGGTGSGFLIALPHQRPRATKNGIATRSKVGSRKRRKHGRCSSVFLLLHFARNALVTLRSRAYASAKHSDRMHAMARDKCEEGKAHGQEASTAPAARGGQRLAYISTSRAAQILPVNVRTTVLAQHYAATLLFERDDERLTQCLLD